VFRIAQRDDGDDEDGDSDDGDQDSGQTFPTAPSRGLSGDTAGARVQTSMPRRRAER
jgi:hypothetical protein